MLQPRAEMPASGVNISEGGLCFRLRQALEVRSLVRLRLTPEGASSRSGSVRASQAMECKGRVAWVIQRLDLSDAAPFFYDVGIEFVDPPPALRQLMVRAGDQPSQAGREAKLPSATIRGRRYVPHLVRETDQALAWHLVVMVDGSPCFSGRYATKRQAAGAWDGFKRRPNKPRASEGKPS